jgi:hypothetical protein
VSKTYIVYNSAMVTTAAPVKQPTGTAIRTMMQLAPNYPIRVVSWGFSADASALAIPGQVELIDTGAIFGTLSTAYATADIQPYNDPNAPAQTAGSTGFPLSMGTTSLSAFATGATTEGAITATRMGDVKLLDPVATWDRDWVLGREFEVPAGHCLRVRATFAASVNAICYVQFEV